MNDVTGIVMMDLSSSDKKIIVYEGAEAIRKMQTKGKAKEGWLVLGFEYANDPGVCKNLIPKNATRY